MSSQNSDSPYVQIGGEQGLRALVERFYDLMELESAAQDIRRLHPPSMDGSRQKLFEFLSGWLGGPSLYIEKYGHPRMRARHLPFAIGEAERDAWLGCMHQAMLDTLADTPLRAALYQAFVDFADHMRNDRD